MGEAYVSDEEYPTYFVTLDGMRKTVASELGPLAGEVLDVATGSAYFAMALAGKHPDIHVTARATPQNAHMADASSPHLKHFIASSTSQTPRGLIKFCSYLRSKSQRKHPLQRSRNTN